MKWGHRTHGHKRQRLNKDNKTDMVNGQVGGEELESFVVLTQLNFFGFHCLVVHGILLCLLEVR